ncbi:hypothetical protein B0H21DRAFT_766194 [Amylocystis lapponica]|nr:hypothetical protein B0H21DRAFT_766194 [Amylocystis lapponica]
MLHVIVRCFNYTALKHTICMVACHMVWPALCLLLLPVSAKMPPIPRCTQRLLEQQDGMAKRLSPVAKWQRRRNSQKPSSSR